MNAPRPYVAVVDDEESVRGALVRLLRVSSFDAEGFASGEELLASLPQRRPDCLVLDLQLPGMTGRELQRRLAGLPAPIPHIMITAHDEPTIRERCLADGAAAYLRKPVRSELLVRSVWQAMQDTNPFQQGSNR